MFESTILSSNQLADQLFSNDHSPKYYRHYPRLFSDYFKDIGNNQLAELSDAGYLYYQATLLLDTLVDDHDFSTLPKSLVLQEETIKILTSIYGLNSSFWELWSERKREYFEAVAIEKKLPSMTDVLFETYTDLADKKSAFGKVAIDCLWHLSKHKSNEVYQDLLESHRHFSIGFQLCDDIKDFEEDITKGQFNWGVYLLNQKKNVKEYFTDASVLNKLFYIKGVAHEVFKFAIDHFQKALDIIERINVESEWKNVVIEMKKTAIRDLDIANHYIETIRKRVENKKQSATHFFTSASVTNPSIKRGLDFIQSQFEEGYSDLKHRMYLGALDGFDNASQIHESDTFPRTMLNDCLFAVAERYNIEMTAFLTNECDYLIEQRNIDEVGGWGYFPTVKEIAADIDDLAQVMQLFIHLDRSDFIDQFCSKPILIALTERTSADGGIETWIIPKYNQSEIQQKQELFNQTRWGERSRHRSSC